MEVYTKELQYGTYYLCTHASVIEIVSFSVCLILCHKQVNLNLKYEGHVIFGNKKHLSYDLGRIRFIYIH